MQSIGRNFFKITITFVCSLLLVSCAQVFTKDKISTNNRVVEVALLLPLSGSEAKFGKEYGQMIAMGMSDGAKTRIRITSYDAANQYLLQQSLEKIFDLGTDIIIGPIYSEPTKIVASQVRGKSTIVLSLSNNPVLADKQVYIYGHAPMKQLEQLTNSFLDQDYKNYILLLPSGRYSSTVGSILKNTIISNGGTVHRTEVYEKDPESIAKSLQLVSSTVDEINENDVNLTQPIIIIADEPAALAMLLNEAKKLHLDKKAILAGDNRIDLNLHQPVDITFTGSLKFNLLQQTNKFNINDFTFLHALAYDAGKMISHYIGRDYSKAQFLARMNASKPFIGVSGNITFIDSIAQRHYDVITKINGQPKLRETIPTASQVIN